MGLDRVYLIEEGVPFVDTPKVVLEVRLAVVLFANLDLAFAFTSSEGVLGLGVVAVFATHTNRRDLEYIEDKPIHVSPLVGRRIPILVFSFKLLEEGSGEEAIETTLETPLVACGGKEGVTGARFVVADEDTVGHGVVDYVVKGTRNLRGEGVVVTRLPETDDKADILFTSEGNMGVGLGVLLPKDSADSESFVVHLVEEVRTHSPLP